MKELQCWFEAAVGSTVLASTILIQLERPKKEQMVSPWHQKSLKIRFISKI
jgi:hypothetical protein